MIKVWWTRGMVRLEPACTVALAAPAQKVSCIIRLSYLRKWALRNNGQSTDWVKPNSNSLFQITDIVVVRTVFLKLTIHWLLRRYLRLTEKLLSNVTKFGLWKSDTITNFIWQAPLKRQRLIIMLKKMIRVIMRVKIQDKDYFAINFSHSIYVKGETKKVVILTVLKLFSPINDCFENITLSVVAQDHPSDHNSQICIPTFMPCSVFEDKKFPQLNSVCESKQNKNSEACRVMPISLHSATSSPEGSAKDHPNSRKPCCSNAQWSEQFLLQLQSSSVW